MPSSTLTVQTFADANVVLTLAGSTAKGAIYKDATRSALLPRTLEFTFNQGNPGSLGNDKLVVKFSDSYQNATTQKVCTAGVKMEVSVPRDSIITATVVKDIMSYLQTLIIDANITAIGSAIVP